MNEALAVQIYVKRLWTSYKPNPVDPAKFDAIDWVEYGQIGSGQKSTTVDRISRLRDKLVPLADRPDDLATKMAHARWNAIKPFYEAWKTGEEMPDSGTPLAAWNALAPEQAAIFKTNGVRTVEEVAALTDVHLARIQVPRLRELITQAQCFIEAQDANRIAYSLEARDEQIKAQQAELDDQKQTIAALLQKVDGLASLLADSSDEQKQDDRDTPRRGPGRPRKNASEPNGVTADEAA